MKLSTLPYSFFAPCAVEVHETGRVQADHEEPGAPLPGLHEGEPGLGAVRPR